MANLTVRRPFIGQNQVEDTDPAQVREATVAQNVTLHDGKIEKGDAWSITGFIRTYTLENATHGIRGLTAWAPDNGTKKIYAVAEQTLWVLDAGDNLSSGSTVLYGGFARNTPGYIPNNDRRPMPFLSFNNRLYIGGNELKVTDGTSVYDAFPDRITTMTVSAVAAGSGVTALPAGDYEYKVTGISETWGIETPASDTETVTVDGTQLARIDIGTWNLDARFNSGRWRIYRRSVVAEEQDWFLLYDTGRVKGNSQPYSAGDTVDDTPDRYFITEDTAPLAEAPSVTGFNILVAHQGIMLAAGAEVTDADPTNTLVTYPTRLYFSKPDRPWTLDRYVTVGGDNDNDPITALVSAGPFVRVYKRDSIWSVSGNSLSTFSGNPQARNVGCRNWQAIQTFGGVDYFLGETEVYAFDGTSEPIPISEPIRDLILADGSDAVSWKDSERNSVSWAVGSNIFTYFIDNSRRLGRPSWEVGTISAGNTVSSEWTAAGGSTETVSILVAEELDWEVPGEDKTRQVIVGLSSGAYCEWGGNYQEWAQIDTNLGVCQDIHTMEWVTNKIDGGQPMRKKEWGDLEVELDPQTSANATNLKIGYRLDGATTTEWLRGTNQKDGMVRRRVNRRSRDIQLVFRHEEAGPVAISGYRLEADLLETH